tara:strand:+ start:2828 stop:4582 length:1755 start_codon:yes stop_codon:yes gene_type:complete
MSQHDMNIANQGFPATRADINNALQAIATNNSGTSAPSTTFANQWFYNESTNKLFIRNEANSAFIEVATLDQTNNEWQITTGQISAGDGDGLVFKTDDGTTRITLSDGGDVTFADGTDIITATAGTDNVRIGEGAGDSIASGGTNNIAIGKNAGTAITTGDDNIAIGTSAGDALTTSEHNVAVGKDALSTETLGSYNTAIGTLALTTQNNSDIDVYNTAVGALAGRFITTGNQNSMFGAQAGDALTTGQYNTALGYKALSLDTKGNRAVGVGYEALANQNFTSSSDNINTAVGFHAGKEITTGAENTVMGGEALDACTVGNGNVALGVQALSGNVNGSRNTAVGTTALKVAEASGSTSSNQYNVALGYGAGLNVSTSGFNTLIGSFAGDTLTSGGSNICLGYGADTGGAGSDNAITIGVNITSSSNDFSFGKASNVVKNDFDSDANWSRSSDVRLKKNIIDQKLGLDFINDLRTVKYNWKASHELDSADSQLNHLYKEDEADNEMNTDVTMHNFIAQEVKAALDTAGVSDFSGWSEDQYGVQQVSREMFVIPLVKAVQELSAKVDALETENTAIKARLDALEAE